MKSWNLKARNAIQYDEAISLFEIGTPIYKIWRNTRGAPDIVARVTTRGDIFPGRPLFKNYWFAHAYCCKINEGKKK